MEKLIKHATIPQYFDQTKNYIEELPPVDMGDYIFIDVVVKNLPVEENIEPEQSGTFEPYIAEPDLKEQVKALSDAVTTLMGV